VGINRWLEKLEPYSNHLMIGIVVATLLAVAAIYLVRSSSATTEAGWSEMASARTADGFLEIADRHPDSSAADWAKLQAARLSYSNGIETSLTDRKSSDESLKQAKDLYNDLVKKNTAPELREEALKGLALTLEATSGGDVDEAVKAYEQFVKEFPESAFRDYAAYRVEELKKPEAGEFYAWFRTQNPKPAERPLPSDGKPPIEGAVTPPKLPEFDQKTDSDPPKADTAAPALPAAPSTEGKLPPTTPATSEGKTTPMPETTEKTAPMPMPEGTRPVVPMPQPEASEKTVPMPETPATPAPMPEPGKSSESSELPSIPKSPVEPPKAP
jgi:hypothetical protein